MGDYISIMSAVFIAGSVYSEELFSQRLRLGYDANRQVTRLARTFNAVTIAARALERSYANLEGHPPERASLAHLFPSPTAVDGKPLLPLTF